MKAKLIILTSLFLVLLCFKNENFHKESFGNENEISQANSKERFFLKNENYFMYKTKKND